jgi:hypothetical protein
MNELKKGILAMNRRHVLQTLAVMSAGSATMVAFAESSSTRLTVTPPGNLSATLRESRELCINLLGRLDRGESRRHLVAGSNSTANKTATHALQELLVLLEQAEFRVSANEQRAVALVQACVDSLTRIEKPLNALCLEGMLPRLVVDSSVAVFGQARQLLSSHRVA